MSSNGILIKELNSLNVEACAKTIKTEDMDKFTRVNVIHDFLSIVDRDSGDQWAWAKYLHPRYMWCRNKIGNEVELNWFYECQSFYFKDPYDAVQFKLVFGALS